MRIAQVAPVVERVPPKKYGGTERIVSVLTEELVRRGHDVTLFASGDSITSAKLVSVYSGQEEDQKIRDPSGVDIWSMANIGEAYKRQEEFDVIHDHNQYLSLPVAQIANTPSLMTLHLSFRYEEKIESECAVLECFDVPLVSISKGQVPSEAKVNHVGTVYNGLSMEHYPVSDEHDDYLLFIGRICPEKGTHHAIEVAKKTGMPLIIGAQLLKRYEPYFKEKVEPHLSDKIRWIGEVTEEERNELMKKAVCLINPIAYREPFGLVMIEAMACGCPPVVFDSGSVREIVVDGDTGFVVQSADEMIDAVRKIGDIDRSKCRNHALENFSEKKMAEGYEAIYKKLVK